MVEQFTAEVQRFRTAAMVDLECLREFGDVELHVHRTAYGLGQQMQLSMEAKALKREFERTRPTQTAVTSYRAFPADWWQHFKEKFFPVWLKRWLPVQWEQVAITKSYTTNNLEVHVCPHLKCERGHLEFLAMGPHHERPLRG